ncbi:hypothetical protein LCGC14_2070470 [marine sediment metagenome]|uniref:Uncharacterized protein n=1 Tax=marine sediment metagenome TaxID=412755 RepID=A0A0F9EIQ2_9ZZZZ
MNEATLADRLRVIVAWIRDGGEGCVRQPDPDQLEGIADEVEALVDQNNDELRFENNRLRDRIAKLSATPYAARVWENLALRENAAGDAATIAKLEAALREIAEGLRAVIRVTPNSPALDDLVGLRALAVSVIMTTRRAEG